MATNLGDMLEGKGDIQTPTSTGDPIVKIVALLFKARSDAHISHLRQADKTLARHDAFGIFYDTIVDIADTLYETYNGLHEVGKIVVDKSEEITEPIKYFLGMYNTIETLRKDVKESFIQNQIDTVQQEIAHALFRFKKITT
jgi:hypothetical protein